ncbi:mercuric transport protein periplasmic component [Variovorax sp. RO1]|uniref:cation transporter n=1 Tax=Variovorax sp. RO1 TaxID=2066034 RepID=UPI000C718815|nr:cation transporter [Variovorax sp. RO1]PLC05673.1 mercuric transport protein periplasmic component [Variovorax sp. RO1]
MRKSLTILMITLMPFAALATTPQTEILDVQNMTCSLCPLTVRKSLENVPGVSRARIDFERKTATVSFDADKAAAPALVKATTEAGYPSTVRK